jgi:hypothetical protein
MGSRSLQKAEGAIKEALDGVEHERSSIEPVQIDVEEDDDSIRSAFEMIRQETRTFGRACRQRRYVRWKIHISRS